MTDYNTRKYALFSAVMASFLTPFMGSAVNLAIPAIGRDFNSGALLLSWVVTSYILASASFLVPFGRLADIIGRKRVFISGIIIFSITAIMCGLSWSIQSLLFFRVLQGIGSAMIFGTSMAILTSVFPPAQRGKVLGINVATVYVGLALGPVLGGVLNHHLGWHYIFYFSAIIALLALAVALKLKGEWAGAKGEKYDFVGAVLYSGGLVALLYGMSTVATSPVAKYIMLVGAAILAIFVFYQGRVKHPILNLFLFRNSPTFAFSNLAALINYSATFAVGFIMSLYLQMVKGYNSQSAGLILLSQPVIMAALSPFAGRISDRIDPRLVASLGMALTALGLLMLCFINIGTSITFIILNLVLLGTGFALFSSPNSNAVMGSVDKKFYGIASSTLGTMRLTGQAVSMALVTLILAYYVGNIELGNAEAGKLVQGARVAFVVFTATCTLGVFASLAGRRRYKPKTAQED